MTALKPGDRVRVVRVADPDYYTRWAARIGHEAVILREVRSGEWALDFEDGTEDQFMPFAEDELELLPGPA